MGRQFLSIYALGWNPAPEADLHRGLAETYAIGLTYTVRLPGVPGTPSLLRKTYIDSTHATENVLRFCMSAIHQNVDLITAANTLLPSGSPIQTYLRWQGCEPIPVPRDATWFWSDPTQAPGLYGFSQEVRFAKAESYRSNATQIAYTSPSS